MKDSNGKERKKRQEQMSLRENKVEILAPAGSYDILMADFAAGADAVYLGGAMFGARAYANNLSQEELLRALDYAHLHDKKIYLTVNTLMKQQELEDRLLPYLEPFYKAGLSAVIVQDFGAFEAIKEDISGTAYSCEYTDDGYRCGRRKAFKRSGRKPCGNGKRVKSCGNQGNSR